MAAHTNPPGHLSLNPFVHCLIVVLLLSGTRRLDCFRPPGLKISVPNPLRPKNWQTSPCCKTEAATPSPGRFSPNPVVLRLIVMLSAIATGQIVWFRLPGRKMKAIPPPPPQRILSIFPFERRSTAPSPSRPSPHPGGHWFIVVYLRLATYHRPWYWRDWD